MFDLLDSWEWLLYVVALIGAGLLVLLLFVFCLPISLFAYGSGESTGIVTTVEDGVFVDSVWFRASDESSQTDEYCFESNLDLKNKLKSLAKSKKVTTIQYRRHLLGGCRDLVILVQ